MKQLYLNLIWIAVLFVLLAAYFNMAMHIGSIEKEHQLICRNISMYNKFCNRTKIPIENIPLNLTLG